MSHVYPFFTQLARTLNAGQSRSVILWGNIHDLYFNGQEYVPLIWFLRDKSAAPGIIQLIYELNGPIRVRDADREKLRNAWAAWKSGVDADTLLLQDLTRRRSDAERILGEFDRLLLDSIGNPTHALEFLRQLTICSRSLLREDLLIIIEAADMLLPAGSGDLAALDDRQLRRISIVSDWIRDPLFFNGGDSVCLVAESRSLVHPRISKMPYVMAVEVPAPTAADRRHYIQHFLARSPQPPALWSTPEALADLTAGLSIHALRQVLMGAAYAGETLEPTHVIDRVELFIQTQLGEDVVEFTKPSHGLEDVVGFSRLKQFLKSELLPRFKAQGDESLPGAAVAGPIGSGKTFIFEAVAGELELPVLVLKNIRSQWFGQTDVIFERLRRVLEALEKVVIFVDEADTQFGRVDSTAHETERRLTGKIQAMMSDSRLRGKVIWLLMTARIHLLSPDIRRPGRVGDLIIPILDPEGEDRRDFIRWTIRPISLDTSDAESLVDQLDLQLLPSDFSAASFAALRSRLKAAQPGCREAVEEIVHDQIPPAIGQTREYQTLQALVNCTRRRLLPDPTIPLSKRGEWERRIRELEAEGTR